uniref:Reverse transcriptase domain-containing protein n=1 Tax=Strongyloides venezuelensis TaxID=75913 RepID=A0A0K0G4U2_STRVS
MKELSNIKSILCTPSLEIMSLIDISNAFQRINLKPHLRKYFVVATEFGYFEPQTPAFGVSIDHIFGMNLLCRF